MIQQPYAYQYEHVAASQTNQILGGTGATGDYLHRMIITVSTAATAAVSILDGGNSHLILPNSPGGGIGVYVINIECASASGAWGITTGAGVEVIAVGIFSA